MNQESRNPGKFLNREGAFVGRKWGRKGDAHIPGFLASNFIPAFLFSCFILLF
jgi:hypothetical protein